MKLHQNKYSCIITLCHAIARNKSNYNYKINIKIFETLLWKYDRTQAIYFIDQVIKDYEHLINAQSEKVIDKKQ